VALKARARLDVLPSHLPAMSSEEVSEVRSHRQHTSHLLLLGMGIVCSYFNYIRNYNADLQKIAASSNADNHLYNHDCGICA
jgi:hypothetical protein